MEQNKVEPLRFNNPSLLGVVHHFASRYSIKEKIFLRHEEIELLPLFLRAADPEEFNHLKSTDDCFFQKILRLLKEVLEEKTGKILFLALRNGNYVILDSWHIKWQDWEIENRHRDSDFLILRDRYYEAQEKIPNIKSLEDFIAVIDLLSIEEIKKFFTEKDSQMIKNLIKKYKKF